jgi:hypothetical protein
VRPPQSNDERDDHAAPIVVNLTFKLLDQFLKLGDERILFGNHSLLMLTCGTLDRQLELGVAPKRPDMLRFEIAS